MIVANISSGLGNQLFQYAAARALSLLHNAKLVGDPVAYSPQFKRATWRALQRDFILKDLDLPIHFRPVPKHILITIRGYNKIRRIMLDGTRIKFTCKSNYDESFALLPDNVLLSGFFQDLRYFLGYQDQIIFELAQSLEHFVKTKGLDQPPVKSDTAALHIRRGDYLNNPEVYPDWFQHYAISLAPYIIEKYNLSELHIFTDDPMWCRKTFGYLDAKVKIITPDKRFEGIGDLVRMSKYPIVAIANSTFSWWAGMLASKNGAHVIAPSKWADWCKSPSSSLYMPNWQCFTP